MRRLKSVLSFILVLILAFALYSCSDKDDAKTPSDSDTSSELTDSGKIIKAEIEMELGGVIKLDLYPDTAPITVANFVKLAKSGFYDGLIFHRVVEGFVIQGGDPEGTGSGGSNENIKGEFSANGVENNLSHKRGVISMARAQPYDSASSQFFICHKDASLSLDGKYAAFGIVTDGMDVVDRIASVKTNPQNDKPLEDQVMKAVRIVGEAEIPDSDTQTKADTEDPEKAYESQIKGVADSIKAKYGDTVSAEIKMKSGEVMKLELYPDTAPLTVQNFISLAEDGFYNGLIFHRAVKDVLIQGGDPEGTGRGGSENKIQGEFSLNGIENSLKHEAGVISMARANQYNSASSQFFICLTDLSDLDGSYAAFGKIVEGLDAAKAVGSSETDSNDKPVEDQVIQEINIIKAQ